MGLAQSKRRCRSCNSIHDDGAGCPRCAELARASAPLERAPQFRRELVTQLAAKQQQLAQHGSLATPTQRRSCFCSACASGKTQGAAMEGALDAFERAAKRWGHTSMDDLLLRALADAEERDAADATQLVRLPIPSTRIGPCVTQRIDLRPHTPGVLLHLDLEAAFCDGAAAKLDPLSRLELDYLHCGPFEIARGGSLALLHRRPLPRMQITPGIGGAISVTNGWGSSITLGGALCMALDSAFAAAR